MSTRKLIGKKSLTFEDVLEKMKLRPGVSGHEIGLHDGVVKGEGYDSEYLNNAFLLYRNPVLHQEIEQACLSLAHLFDSDETMEDVKATRKAIKALCALYDRISLLSSICLEEREKEQEARKNPETKVEFVIDSFNE